MCVICVIVMRGGAPHACEAQAGDAMEAESTDHIWSIAELLRV
jgi:hypothetical protein